MLVTVCKRMFSFMRKMVKSVFIFISCFVLNRSSAQIYEFDYITATPVVIPSPSTSPYYKNWNELLPALDLIKNSSNFNDDKIMKLAKILKYLLLDETQKDQDVLSEDIKNNAVKLSRNLNTDNIDDEGSKPMNDVLGDKNFITPKNNSANFSKVLAKISAALKKVEKRNESDETSVSLDFMPLFRSNENVCKNILKQPFIERLEPQKSKTLKQPEINFTGAKFSIPYQRAADILEETSSYIIPKNAYCDPQKYDINFNSVVNSPELNSDKLPFQLLPNSIQCVDSDNSIAVLFKPKTVSMTHNYGNFLKKTSTNILVPYHVAKLSI